jgi:hypothetical protein
MLLDDFGREHSRFLPQIAVLVRLIEGGKDAGEKLLARKSCSALMATSLVPVRKWSRIAVLALMATTFSVAGLAASEAPGPLFEQSPSGSLDSPRDVEKGAQFAAAEAPAKSQPRSAFEERFAALIDEPDSAPRPSFDERFAAAFDRYEEEDEGPALSTVPSPDEPKALDKPPPQRSAKPDLKKSAPVVRSASLEVAPNDTELMQEPGDRTAIYDISAHAVYLPTGERLEAHSGLGSGLDDPRYIGVKGRGPTPPNVYRLVLREQLFHGVRAIRLVPVNEQKMFGRAGILAHPYMLGPNGQSNGCVSFQDYPAFLNAFLRGEVDSLAVVEHLEWDPIANAGLGWLPGFIRKLLTPS